MTIEQLAQQRQAALEQYAQACIDLDAVRAQVTKLEGRASVALDNLKAAVEAFNQAQQQQQSAPQPEPDAPATP